MAPAADTPSTSVTVNAVSSSSKQHKLSAPLTKPMRNMNASHTPSPNTIRSSPRSPKRPRSHLRGSSSVSSLSPFSPRRSALFKAAAERASAVDMLSPQSPTNKKQSDSGPLVTPPSATTPDVRPLSPGSIARSLLAEFDAVDDCKTHLEGTPSSSASDDFFADSRRRFNDSFRMRWNWDPVRDCALDGCWRWEPMSARPSSATTV